MSYLTVSNLFPDKVWQRSRNSVKNKPKMLSAVAMLAVVLLGQLSVTARADLMLVSEDQLSDRMYELTFTTPALSFVPFWVPAPPKVRVLLPDNYYVSSGQRYPVLYLLHGGLGSHTSWTNLNAEALTDGLPVIVVMPTGGPVGYYKNWFNSQLGFAPPEWKTFHIDQLLPWIDANYRTVNERSSRAVAGFSMGGFGAFSYAARHPDLFGVAASLSGSLDMNNPVNDIRSPAQSFLAGAIFGSYETEEVRYRGINAPDMARNLTNTDLSIYTGDTSPPESTYILTDSLLMHDILDELGVRHRFTLNEGASHSSQNAQQSLADWLPHMMSTFSQRPDPQNFTFTAIEADYSNYGWDVQMLRDVLEFSALSVSGHRSTGNHEGGVAKLRFELVGNGNAVVTTPELGLPNLDYSVEVKDQLGTSVHTLQTDENGRLAIAVSLGSGNQFQQFSPEADALSTGPSPDDTPFTTRGNGSRFYTAEVLIDKANQ